MAVRFVGSTVTRLRFASPFAPPDRSAVIREGLERASFIDYLTPTQKGVREGFARADKPLVVPVEWGDYSLWMADPYLTFAWRTDTKKVPPKRLRAALNERVESWCKTALRERCPKAVKEDLREQIELELLPRCMASSSVVGVVWNLNEDWMLLSTRANARVERIRKELHRAFGIVTHIEETDEALGANVLAALAETEPLQLAPHA